MLNINLWIPQSTALGPGNRAVVWVQGCKKDCEGCISPEMKPTAEHTLVNPVVLGEQILSLAGIEGLTISGGEPFDQAHDILTLLKTIKTNSNLTTMVYSGYTIQEIESKSEMAKCLNYIDLLVEGTFNLSLPTALWRGSINQKLISPNRYYDQKVLALWAGQSSNTLEFHLVKNKLFTIGIPDREFIHEFQRRLSQKGISVECEGGNE